MNDFEVRRAEDNGTIKRCFEIRNKVFTVEKGVPKEIEVDRYDCLNDDCDHFLILYDNTDAGTIRCLHTADDTVRIQRFCFLNEYRGLGIGKAVIGYIEDHYRENSIAKIELDAKFEVLGFYEKCGYKRISEAFIEAGIEHVKMLKVI